MNTKEEILRLSARITTERFAKMNRALQWRTNKLVLVLEDIFQPHNAAAILRSCDAFGIGRIHFIENLYRAKISSGVDTGVSKWQDLHFHTSPSSSPRKSGMPKPKQIPPENAANTLAVLTSLKDKGYTLVASSLDEGAGTLDDVPVDKPLALMLGTELTGLSDVALGMADVRFKLPMLGFAQSFNVSVFAAIVLARLCERMRAYSDDWMLSQSEKDELLLCWLRLSVGENA